MGLGSARWAPVRHRLPSRAKWEGADCKVSAAGSDLSARTGRLCRPEWPSPSSSRCCKVNSCPTPLSLCFSRCTGPARERPSLSRTQARSDGALPGATGRRLPWRPPCFAPVQAAAGPCRPPALAAARRLTSRPGGVRARPASPRPPARAGHAGAARRLAGPGRAAAARVMPPASVLRLGRSRGRGRQTGRGHVTVAELSSGGDLCGGSRGADGVPACLLGAVGLSEGFS